ncbi:hypothetical protein DFA_09463 [Cavenderia fasciculata]|uniref:Carbohydrate binding domain-containing protein n=1 Tax=Cavenderia fasciculata TaxID=261658 RepID=F4Q7P5_CACFS|nr:uncharacterized protein DFA_09463 [Cavenderia fasciculata]EGG15795.1 hypothetical protein DFA_09463 [Cavenderia fasciculata]|eukprot:XP_004352120.1 hypothetical protein DFA_09463 [Cavenderia fasciculata]
MKAIFALCVMLLALSVAAAHHHNEIGISHRLIGTWTDSQTGECFSQYDVTITNGCHGSRVCSVCIGTDATCRLRDNNSIWNVVRLSNGDITLPANQTINLNSSYTFGYIVHGTAVPTLCVKSVSFC